jgi:hypothetical protein
VRSSTSHSDGSVLAGGTARSRALQGAWGRTWLLALLLGIAVVGAAEAHWRAKGFAPSVVDDLDLWCAQRDIANSGRDVVAVLGGSRAQLGFAVPTFVSAFASYRVADLTQDGKGPMAALQDLAIDPSFTGIALVDTEADNLISGGWRDQSANVQHYRRLWTLARQADRATETAVQSALTTVRSELGLRNLIAHRLRPSVPYITMTRDRWRPADYSRLDIVKHREHRVARVQETLQPPQTSPSKLAAWRRDVTEIDRWVKMIQARGGQVAFVPFVRTDESREAVQAMYPRQLYWDYFAAHTSAVCIHYLDVPALRSFECPDTSHLDYRDAPRYTLALAAELEKRGVIRR